MTGGVEALSSSCSNAKHQPKPKSSLFHENKNRQRLNAFSGQSNQAPTTSRYVLCLWDMTGGVDALSSSCSNAKHQPKPKSSLFYENKNRQWLNAFSGQSTKLQPMKIQTKNGGMPSASIGHLLKNHFNSNLKLACRLALIAGLTLAGSAAAALVVTTDNQYSSGSFTPTWPVAMGSLIGGMAPSSSSPASGFHTCRL
jgi:hypothetical protein